MKYIDLTLPTPEENLALDEALLEMCEEAGGDEILRFWAPVPYFVVIGYGQKAEREVNISFCRQNRIVVLRRISGGGAVLQGTGCLNYSLVLKIPAAGPLASISETNCHILKKHQETLGSLLNGQVQVEGTSDLTLNGKKISGNAQRRKRNAFLFHGTFLISFNISFIENVLPLPSRMPAYRQNRTHNDFLANLNLPAAAVKEALRHCWSANEPCQEIPFGSIRKLADEKYTSDDWNFRL